MSSGTGLLHKRRNAGGFQFKATAHTAQVDSNQQEENIRTALSIYGP